MSEAELHFLRGRMNEGRAEQGPPRRAVQPRRPSATSSCRPAAWPWTPTSRCRAWSASSSTSSTAKAACTGCCATWSHHGIRLPVRPHSGPNRGQLEWHRPNRETLQNLLHHPIYAGYYRYGSPGPRPAAAGARPARDGADDPQAGGVPGPAGGPLPGLHHARALLGQPAAAGGQPRRAEAAGAVAPWAIPCWADCSSAAAAAGA